MIKTENDKIIKLRLFSDDDLDDVVMVNRECLPENYAPYFFMEIFYKYPKGFWVAVDISNNDIIGYCMWRTEKSFSYFKKSLHRIKVAHLISIAVLKEQRRKKVGEQLLNSGIESMKIHYEVKECYLEVRISNLAAIKMYEKNGFKKIKKIKKYYKDGENAHLMAKELL